MSVELITILMIALLFILMFTGMHVTFAIATTAITFALIFSPRSLMTGSMALFSTPYQPVLLTLPMFIFMGSMIRYSGIADASFEAIRNFTGGIPGGMSVATIVICALFAAITGVVPPAAITMGLIAVPALLKHGYSKQMSVGPVAAGSALADLIPPSGGMIFYALLAKVSVGKMFIAGLVPGIILATLFSVYIVIWSKINPNIAPIIPKEELLPWAQRFNSLIVIWPFILLIFIVLGLIYLGITTPTEAAVFGAITSLGICVANRRLTWKIVKDSLKTTVDLTVMGIWIIVAASFFVNIFSAIGGQDILTDLVTSMPGGEYGAIAFMCLTILLLGFFMDDWAIITLLTPLYVPIVVELGFDAVWFGILFICCIQTSFLTPPYGFVLFCLKGVLPKNISMMDVYKSVVPYILIQVFNIFLVIAFPILVLWLPNKM